MSDDSKEVIDFVDLNRLTTAEGNVREDEPSEEDGGKATSLPDDAFWVDGACVVCQSVMEEERQHCDDCEADALIRRVDWQEAALFLAEKALEDLGACDDENCPEPNCLHALVVVRRALRGE